MGRILTVHVGLREDASSRDFSGDATSYQILEIASGLYVTGWHRSNHADPVSMKRRRRRCRTNPSHKPLSPPELDSVALGHRDSPVDSLLVVRGRKRTRRGVDLPRVTNPVQSIEPGHRTIRHDSLRLGAGCAVRRPPAATRSGHRHAATSGRLTRKTTKGRDRGRAAVQAALDTPWKTSPAEGVTRQSGALPHFRSPIPRGRRLESECDSRPRRPRPVRPPRPRRRCRRSPAALP